MSQKSFPHPTTRIWDNLSVYATTCRGSPEATFIVMPKIFESQDEDDLQELSLDALRLAFAECADTPKSEKVGIADEIEPEEKDSPAIDDAKEPEIEINPRTILEAVLFVGNKDRKYITQKSLMSLMRNVSQDELLQEAEQLNAVYEAYNAPYRIETSQDGLRMALCNEFDSLKQQFYGKIKESQLSQQAIDILALVAYRQPISAEEIQKAKQTSVGAILSQLVKRDLLSAEKVKRAVVYRTTARFLQFIGISSLDDLPRTGELEF